jgi:purine-binding chemotaxis protein CheW
MTVNQEEFMEEDTQRGRFLTFSLGEEVFGVEIRFVTEIIGMQPITSIPEAPDYIRGIVNLRGKIIPVMDMRLKFGLEQIAYDDRTCIIVIDTDAITIGLIVDKVAEVLMIGDENIAPPPDAKTGLENRYISGIGKVGTDVKLLLSCEKLFNQEDAEILAS